MLKLPDEFIRRIEISLEKESSYFFKALSSETPVSVRLNKTKGQSLFRTKEHILWCNYGRYLEERPSFTLDPLFHAGAYYVQEAASMVLAQILLQLQLNEKPLMVLDLCAAPGGKTTLLHDYLHEESIIIANEVIKSRARILKENIIKWGTKNVIITSADASEFIKSGLFFDLILVDAPCSGEGMFRKDKDSIDEWSPENVEQCSLRQKRILDNIIPLLNESGYIIYSTCTYNDLENIDQVEYLNTRYDLEPKQIETQPGWGLKEIVKNNVIGYQAYPHLLKGEGFFFSVLKNKSFIKKINAKTTSKLRLLSTKEATPLNSFIDPPIKESIYQHSNGDCYFISEKAKIVVDRIQTYLQLIYAGVKLGNINKTVFIPDHALSLSSVVNPHFNTASLNLDEALSYLRREINTIESKSQGWHIAQYQTINLGWFKQLGNRINNYYPVEWRIRM